MARKKFRTLLLMASLLALTSSLFGKISTSTALASSPNPSTYGASVTFTATVTPSAATGTVTFKDGSTTLGTGTLSGGVATLTKSTITAGTHSITASYGGDINYAASSSSVLTQVVNKAGSSVAISSSANPAVYGATVKFTATLTPTGGTGTVTFYDGSNSLGTSSVSGSKATLSTTSLTGGSHSITASYSGDSNFNGSTSPVLTETITQAKSTTTVASAVNPSVYGSAVIFTATVSPATTTGTVTFKDGSTTLGTSTLSGGTATFSVSTLVVGTHSITAVYGGDGNYSTSTSTALTQTVKIASSEIVLLSSSNPATAGYLLTFTASMTGGAAGETVTFKDGSTTLGTGAISGGLATYATSALAIGTHSITAVYAGDSNYTGATSAALSQAISSAPQVATTSLPGGNVQAPYSVTLSANNGTAPYTWSVTSGSLPAGLSLSTSTGAITGTPTTAGTVSFTVQVKDADLVTATQSLSIAISSLPSGWADSDIGTVGQAGSATFSVGTFTIAGAGAGIGGTADGMHFGYQTLTGDGSIVARIASLQGSQGAIMIRETLNPGAADVSVISSGNIFMQDRPSTGAGVSYQNPYGVGGFPVPVWVQLVRSGNNFTGSVSTDGANWTSLGTANVTMAQTVYIGLAVSGQGSLATATFDGVSINSTASPAPLITALSPTTASIGNPVAILGNNFGFLQNGSMVLLNGNPVAVNTWSETGIGITIPTGAASGPVVVSVAPSMNDSNPMRLEITGQPLPSSWGNEDLGTVGSQIGSATFSSGKFTLNGGGSGFGGTADQLQFAYQQLVGDGSITARLVSLQNPPSGYTQAGVMIRETLGAGAADASVFWGWNNALYMQQRSSTGASASNLNSGQYGYSIPVWLQLVRTGSTFVGSISTDGVNWTQLGSTTISMASTVYIGLGVSGSGYLESANFDSVSINSAANPAPVITGLSATSASIGSQVQINGSNFGAIQGTSAVYLNGSPVTINAWNNTSIVFTVPTGATSGLVVVAVAPSMNDSNGVNLTVTSQPLPSPWLDQDVGVVGTLVGSATYSGGVFTVSGAGAGIGGNADAMHFAYQQLVGDGSIVARLSSLQSDPYPTYPQGGVMIRETLSPGATNASVYYGWNGGSFMNYRPSTGAATTNLNGNGIYGFAPPEWMKLVRTGNTFTGYVSSDGVNWTQAGTATVTMAQAVYAGLVVSGNTYLKAGTFDNVSVVDGTTPFVSSVTPVIGTVGTTVTITGSNFGSSTGNTVSFNGVTSTNIVSWTSTQIVALVPAGTPPGTGSVTVTVNSISSPATQSSMFTVMNPVITSLQPPAGPVGGTIIINGSGFGSSQNGSVTINGVTANIAGTCTQNAWHTCWSDTQIQAIIAVGTPTGAGQITVTNDGFSSNAASFTVSAAPVITTASPLTGEPTTPLTIQGSGFGGTQSNSTVAVGGFVAPVNSWSDGLITASVPAIPMNGNITVTVAGVAAQGPLFVYNAINQLTASNGAVTTYSSGFYGGGWRIYSVAGPGCSTCSVRGNAVNTYDANGNLQSTTDANGNTVSYTYDSNNNMLSQTAHLDDGTPVVTSYTYNNFSEVLTMTDALGNTTTNTYDAHGNLQSVTTPAPDSHTPPSTTQFSYNPLGELTQIIDPLGNKTVLTYFPTGLIQTITDAQSNVTTYGYDPRGNRTSVIDPINGAAHPTTFTYDLLNHLTGITYPDGSAVSFGYDPAGRRITATDQNHNTTHYGYDDAYRLISVQDPAGNLTQYGYDTEGNLTSITDANNHTTTFSYDTLGRVTKTTFPSTLYETYGYDQLYNLTSKTDRNNHTIQYVYDTLSRLKTKTYPDQTAANYVYDLVGKIKSVTDPTGTYGFAYDNMGRLIGTTTQYAFLPGYNYQNTYSYDGASNRVWLGAPDGSINVYAYDTLNRLSTLTNSLTGQFGFSYDALSRRTQLTRPNGVTTAYSYQPQTNWLASVLHKKGATTLDGATYTYDAAGNRQTKLNAQNNITSGYTYDGIYELTKVVQGTTTTESYSYDAVGNRLSSLTVPLYNYNPSNELTSNSSGSYSYDANGNTLSDAQGRSFTWDFENRLIQATNPGVGTTTFRYDPFGRRIQKSGPLGTTDYLYDGPNLIEEMDNSGNVLGRYTQDRDIDSPLSEFRASTTSYYQADEALGSITSLSNGAGALANTYTYDSFGNLTASSGTLTNPFRYTGREFDSETGLYFYRARYFDPAVGRFISEDPMRFGAGVDFYPYVDNSPVNEIDPFGLTAGPKNPRAGTRCRPTDSCSTLKGKIFLLERTISSHQGWDWTMGWPRGGGRHSQEIADFWNALARCMQMFEKKCKKDQKQCDKDEGFPEPAPQPTPDPNSPSVMPIPIDPIIPPMPMPEPMPEPIFPLEPVFPF